MDTVRDDFSFAHRQAAQPLEIIIIGAGIGGLATGLGLARSGHRVTILEQAKEILEYGAGIQLPPNASRILNRFGVLEEVMGETNLLEKISIRRYDNDEELGVIPLMPGVSQKHGAPLGVIHRGDLQRILLEAANKSGCQILTSRRVIRVDDSFLPWVQVEDGTWYSSDLVIAADGVKSSIRSQIAASCGSTDKFMSTGDSAYRLLIPRERLKHNPRALEKLEANSGIRWMGPGGHIMAYPVKNNSAYNVVLIHPAKVKQNTMLEKDSFWINPVSKREVLNCYRGWSSQVQEIISCVPDDEVIEWTMNTHPRLPRWVRGHVALIGDACHPMLPYVAQGAANAIEDAGVIVAALTCTSDVILALEVYEIIRKERGELIQASAAATRESLHLPEGDAQKARDEAIRKACQGEGRNPDRWADREWQYFMWSVDVMKDTIEQWDDLAGRVRSSKPSGIYASRA
ncbi:salicylate hydroxylase [Xylariales sp. PMI_506]|nr:salicylate hydroxylase [Xylariales sp. PMI_506]